MYTVDDCLLWAYAALEVALPVAPVTIQTPSEGAVVASNAVHVSGVAGAETSFVSLAEGTHQLGVVDVADGGAWASTVDLGPTAGGQRTITATGFDAGQHELSPSDSVTIVSDTAAPSVVVQRPKLQQPSFGQIEVSGTATDDIAVASVTVYAENMLTGEQLSAQATCGACGGQSVSFNGRLALGPGLYRVWATAVDLVGHQGSASSIAINLLDPFTMLP